MFLSRNKTKHGSTQNQTFSQSNRGFGQGSEGWGCLVWIWFVFKVVLFASKPSLCHCQGSLQESPSWVLLVKEVFLHLSNRN